MVLPWLGCSRAHITRLQPHARGRSWAPDISGLLVPPDAPVHALLATAQRGRQLPCLCLVKASCCERGLQAAAFQSRYSPGGGRYPHTGYGSCSGKRARIEPHDADRDVSRLELNNSCGGLRTIEGDLQRRTAGSGILAQGQLGVGGPTQAAVTAEAPAALTLEFLLNPMAGPPTVPESSRTTVPGAAPTT